MLPIHFNYRGPLQRALINEYRGPLVAVYFRVFDEKTNLREGPNIFLGETNYGGVCSKIGSHVERF